MNEYSYTERHMGTEVTLSFVCLDRVLSETMAQHVFTIIRKYESIFSRFLPESELSRLNKNGQAIVSSVFMEVVVRSLELAKLTDDAFNPLVQVKRLGYHSTYTALNKQSVQSDGTLYSTDLSSITIAPKTNTITLGSEQQLDFGGILKGYLANLLADEVKENYPTCTGCIINIGGDIATRGYDEFHEPFIFFLYNPVTGEEIPVALKDKSLASSGTYARVWKTKSGINHHIVDSTSQRNPDQNLMTVSIIAQDGALTEALTKLFLTRGVELAVQVAPPQIYNYQYFTVSSTGDITSTIV